MGQLPALRVRPHVSDWSHPSLPHLPTLSLKPEEPFKGATEVGNIPEMLFHLLCWGPCYLLIIAPSLCVCDTQPESANVNAYGPRHKHVSPVLCDWERPGRLVLHLPDCHLL